MGSLTIDIWTLIVGALAGLVAVIGARGGNRIVIGALLGAVTALVLQILRGFL
ncbi:hypothetical protein [Pseudooceanicola aestuarii]|uniref:hypothetical protein n=1 Tax=Pseudooceanicola aestuarii TaxID=2697319 RepID=UPI0013D1E6A0|nr:hypothetical protein [Pseudooceanicola aestuarii]